MIRSVVHMISTSDRRRTAPLLRIDLEAVAANTRLIRTRTTGSLMAVVKADGFGHGASSVACTAMVHGASSLGVTSIQEAVALRTTGIVAPILSWLNPVDADFASALTQDIAVAVPSVDHLQAVARTAAEVGTRAIVHLQADTGMARDGASSVDWLRLSVMARDAQNQGLISVVGLMGHLGSADTPLDPANAAARRMFQQFTRVVRGVGLRPTTRHLAATAATLTDPRSHYEMSRVGIGLVGVDPSGAARLRPAMTLTAPVVSTRDVPAGTPVGYRGAYTTSRATTLALLPIGYADGVPRTASGRAEILLNGSRRPIAGLVSMDQTIVDVGHDAVQPGDVATVMGPGDLGEPTVIEWADWAGTIAHEVMTGLGDRIPREILPARQLSAAERHDRRHDERLRRLA